VFRASIGTLIFTVLTYVASHAVLMAEEAKLKAEVQLATEQERQAIINQIRHGLAQSRGHESRCMEELK